MTGGRPDRGTDDEPAPGRDQDDCDAVPAGEQGRQGRDPGRAVRDDGLAP